MTRPTEKTVKRLFALSNNQCAFPECETPIVEPEAITGEICHIKARNQRGSRFDASQTEKERHAHENLLLLCKRHHKIVDDNPGQYTADVLLEIKRVHENAVGRAERENDSIFAKQLLNVYSSFRVDGNSGNVAINSPGAIQGHQIHIKAARSKVSVEAPPGTIGAKQELARYVRYLVTRYNEFASADPSRGEPFKFAVISKNIENKFGAQWKLLPVETFDDLCSYLHARIDKTRRAKLNAAKGYRSYSTFGEFSEK